MLTANIICLGIMEWLLLYETSCYHLHLPCIAVSRASIHVVLFVFKCVCTYCTYNYTSGVWSYCLCSLHRSENTSAKDEKSSIKATFCFSTATSSRYLVYVATCTLDVCMYRNNKVIMNNFNFVDLQSIKLIDFKCVCTYCTYNYTSGIWSYCLCSLHRSENTSAKDEKSSIKAIFCFSTATSSRYLVYVATCTLDVCMYRNNKVIMNNFNFVDLQSIKLIDFMVYNMKVLLVKHQMLRPSVAYGTAHVQVYSCTRVLAWASVNL